MSKTRGDDLPALRITQLEAEVQEAHRELSVLRRVLDTIPAVVLRISLDGTIEYVNRVLPEYELRPPVGQSIYSYAPADQHDVMRTAIETAARTGEDTSFDSVALAPDGTRDWYHTIVAAVREGDATVGVTLSASNVSRLMATEQALRESRARVALALDAGNVGVWRWDRRDDHVDWDDKLCSMFRIAPADAPTTVEEFLALVSEDQREAMSAHIEASVASGIYIDFELRVDAPEGVRWFVIKGGASRDEAGDVVGLLGGVVDDTERRRLMDHVRDAQKLDAMGQLAAGVAHNFNNMLAGVVPVLEMAEREARPKLAEFLRDARQSALRAAELVKSLMLVGRRELGTSPRLQEPLSVVLERAVELCRRTFSRHITLETSELERAQAAQVDGVQMEQALLNLLLNARDALEGAESRGARISVSAAVVSPGVALGGRHELVEVRIRDTGHGMDETTRARVFEPFFTTKPTGAGTGLGLATAWATLKAHGGALTCESTPGVGTVFTIQLPTSAAVPDVDANRLTTDRDIVENAWVLLIDDEEGVLRPTAASLESEGLRVVTASSGADGVRLFAEHPVDVVVLDYSMPGQTPQRTLAELRALRPSVPVILYTGLAVQLDGVSAYVAKPATATRLRVEIRRVIQR